MKSYNGFTATQRNRAQAWLTSQWRSGKLKRPTVCMACTQDQGIIDAHAEDYSEPFAAGKTDQYHLCFRCHMSIHCRFTNKDNFARYANEVYAGTMFAPFYKRDFGTFSAQHLNGWAAPVYKITLDSTNVLWDIANAKLSTQQ